MSDPTLIRFALPKGWGARRAKYLFRLRSENGLSHDPPLSASQELGVVPQQELERHRQARAMVALSGLDGFQLVKPGDFVISLRSFEGGIELSRCRGVISPVYSVMEPHGQVVAEYFRYYLKEREFIDRLSVVTTGVRDGKTVRYEDFAGLELPLPPLSEQRAIAAFLDRETARIDALIADKERLIALLEEKRQAVISSAVTRGLNLAVPIKDSGVSHWGQIPSNWKMTKLRHLVPDRRQIMYGIVLPGPHVDDGIPIVKGGNCEPGRLRLEFMSRTSREIESGYERSRLLAGDIVYAIRGSIGAAEIVPVELTGANLTQDAARISPKPDIDVRWLLYAVRSSPFFAKLEAGALGATIRGINIRDLKRADLPCPDKNEQARIADYLDQQTHQFEALTQRVTDGIARLQEYRVALISAAVTGQVDVCGEVMP